MRILGVDNFVNKTLSLIKNFRTKFMTGEEINFEIGEYYILIDNTLNLSQDMDESFSYINIAKVIDVNIDEEYITKIPYFVGYTDGVKFKGIKESENLIKVLEESKWFHSSFTLYLKIDGNINNLLTKIKELCGSVE